MLTANRFQQFLNSAREWDALIKQHLDVKPVLNHRLANHDGAVVFELDVPGYERSDLDVEVEKNNLSIRIQEQQKNDQETGDWKLHERGNPSGEYLFQFPFQIDSERTEVKYENGILRIEIQRPEEDTPRKLEVK